MPADEPAADGTSKQSARAAALHAAVLTGTAAAPLGQQLELLLHLLALPPALQAARIASSVAAEPLLPSSSAAVAYACSVLQQSGVAPSLPKHAGSPAKHADAHEISSPLPAWKLCQEQLAHVSLGMHIDIGVVCMWAGHMLSALSLPVLEALARSPAVARHALDLAAQLREILDRRRPGGGVPPADRGPFQAGLAGSSGAFELQAFTSDGLQRRSQVGKSSVACALARADHLKPDHGLQRPCSGHIRLKAMPPMLQHACGMPEISASHVSAVVDSGGLLSYRVTRRSSGGFRIGRPSATASLRCCATRSRAPTPSTPAQPL